MKIKIIYEDDGLMVIDKPPRMIVNRAETTRHKFTVEDWLEKRQAEKLERNGIVHRLDKETSGLLVIAKTKEAMEQLQLQFKNRQVQKSYLALVHGIVRPEIGVIDLPISRNPFNRKKFGVFIGGRKAVTKYKVIRIYQAKYSLVEVNPLTGRTHQIRVHFQHQHWPLVADGLYAGRKTSNQDRRWCPRLFLHAAKIRFFQPKNQKIIELKSELPSDLQKVIKRLEKD